MNSQEYDLQVVEQALEIAITAKRQYAKFLTEYLHKYYCFNGNISPTDIDDSDWTIEVFREGMRNGKIKSGTIEAISVKEE